MKHDHYQITYTNPVGGEEGKSNLHTNLRAALDELALRMGWANTEANGDGVARILDTAGIYTFTSHGWNAVLRPVEAEQPPEATPALDLITCKPLGLEEDHQAFVDRIVSDRAKLLAFVIEVRDLTERVAPEVSRQAAHLLNRVKA